MSQLVRYDNSAWPLIRVLYADVFASDGSGPWTEATYWSADPPAEVGSETSSNGIFLEECTRQALPGIGEATLTMDYGLIDGVQVSPLDLDGKLIRIQAADRPTNQTLEPTWRTIWVGRCEWQEDNIDAAASAERGTRTYRCNDLLYAFAYGYMMDRHANYANTGALAYGHPGYNYDKDTPNVAIGNRESTGGGFAGPDSTSITYFAINDSAATQTTVAWTDREAAENAMLLRRAAGDPIFTVEDPASLVAGATAIPVSETDRAWDVINRIFDRRRGKGMAYLDWADDSATPDGALSAKISVRPQLYNDLTYTNPTGTSVTIAGSSANAEHFAPVDLEGDHRLVPDSFQLRSTQDSAVDELTTEGERIEVAVTASGDDNSIAYRWTTELEAAWQALATAESDAAAEAKYRPVLQAFGIKRIAGVNYANGDGSDAGRADYWTNAIGQLSITHTDVTAPQMIDVMDDLPLYEGYDYSLTPPAPAESGDVDGKPRRRKPTVMVRTTTNRFVMPKDYIAEGAQVQFDDDAMWVEWGGDEDLGLRSIRGTYPGTADRTITEDSLTFVIGLRMPQRPRIVSAISGTVRRRLTIRVPDMHLWIAHPGCIWDLDKANGDDDGSPARRVGGTVGAVPGKILRDDRDALARIHYLAWEWYRSDSGRAAASWSLRACGLLPSWRDLGGAQRVWPRIGQLVTTINAAGSSHSIMTPISRVVYSNREGTTTWSTDWQEFDHGAA